MRTEEFAGIQWLIFSICMEDPSIREGGELKM